MENLTEIIEKRQSVRKYSDKEVEKEKILQVIEAARLAPSACNSQPWRFIVVEEKELLERFKDKVFGGIRGANPWAKDAPVVIAICADVNFISKVGGWLKGTDYYLMDIGIAGEHLALRATELGLGTCWIGWFNKGECKKLLKIPKNIKIVALITLGYPSDEQREKKRHEMSEILYWNSWGRESP